MIYREYGNTGKQVSLLGFGGMRFHDPDNGRKALKKALDCGVNYFDTAPAYPMSEPLFGEVLAGKDVYISTKSMISSEPTAQAVIDRAHHSMQVMHREKIDFFHMWCIKNLDQYRQVMAPGGPYEGALKLKERGEVDHIVFSCHIDGADVTYIVDGENFEGVTVGMNLLNYKHREAGVKAAGAAGMGVAIMNPLGGGMIPRMARTLELQDDGGKGGVVGTALRFLASYREVSTIICGMGYAKEVEENARALRSVQKPSEEIISNLKEKFSVFDGQFCTQCGYCLPVCPQNIEIPFMMLSLDRYKLNIVKEARQYWGWYKGEGNEFHGSLPSDCTECGECELVCTQHLDIINRLKQCDAIFEKGQKGEKL